MRKIFEFFKKYQIILGLALLAGLIISYKLLFPQTTSQAPGPSPTPIPTPTNSLLPTPESEKGVTEEKLLKDLLIDFPLAPYLPYPDKNKLIIRYSGPLTLEIFIKQAGVTKQDALDWISSKKVDPQTHQIIWK